MDETQGSWTRGSCVPEEGSPFSDGAHGQPERELALGTCDWRVLLEPGPGLQQLS